MIYSERLDPVKFMNVLDHAKTLKGELSVIPRDLLQMSAQSSITSISYNAIVTTSNMHDLKDPSYYTLWNDPSLDRIALNTKDINNFTATRKQLFGYEESGKIVIPPIEEMYLDYVSYYVNGKTVSIAHRIREAKAGKDGTVPVIPLIPHQDIAAKIEMMTWEKDNAADRIVNRSDITNNEEFRNIIDAKAGAGATMWMPKIKEFDFKCIPYAISLTSSILNVSKGDSVYLSIYDRIPNQPGHVFISEFYINKSNKKCELSTYMLMMKMI